MDLKRLADELWCGNHGLGDVSRFLLRALDNDESAARAEFSKFLQGKLSDRLLKLSRRAVGKDGRPHRHGRSLGARGRTMNGSKQPATGRSFVACRGRDWPVKTALARLRAPRGILSALASGGARSPWSRLASTRAPRRS